MKTIISPFQSLAIPELVVAGRAVYTPHDWKDGIDSGHQYVAQVFSAADHDGCETSDFLRDAVVLSNDCEADQLAALFSASPRLADLLVKLSHPSFAPSEATRTEARNLLTELGFNMSPL